MSQQETVRIPPSLTSESLGMEVRPMRDLPDAAYALHRQLISRERIAVGINAPTGQNGDHELEAFWDVRVLTRPRRQAGEGGALHRSAGNGIGDGPHGHPGRHGRDRNVEAVGAPCPDHDGAAAGLKKAEPPTSGCSAPACCARNITARCECSRRLLHSQDPMDHIVRFSPGRFRGRRDPRRCRPLAMVGVTYRVAVASQAGPRI